MRREGGTLLNECARGNFDDGNRLGNTWRVPDHILAEEKENLVMVLDVVVVEDVWYKDAMGKK